MPFGFVSTAPEDDLMHPVGVEPDFNESAYYNFTDSTRDVGGWVRIGNRVNEGHAEVMLGFGLPDETTVFWFARPAITGNEGHDAGGMRFEVVTPNVEHRISYNGPALRMKDANDIQNPSRAYKQNPTQDCSLQLTVRGLAQPNWPWASLEADESQESFDRSYGAHVEQHISVSGVLRVGTEEFPIDGLGMRDHSWGARNWQHAPWWRWASCSFGEDFGLSVMQFGDPDGGRHTRGFVHRGPGPDQVRVIDAEFDTTYDDKWNTTAARIAVHTEDGARHDIEGAVWSLLPLFIPGREGQGRAAFTEGMARWRCGDLTGVGKLEHKDQIAPGSTIAEAKAGRP